ncbi:NAD(P)-binding protein [Agrocybe pediades]|nr:NAD(P)-binding protein [Agrocybe pediades]
MAPVANVRALFNEVPKEYYPEPGKTTVIDTTHSIDPETVSLDGGILIKTLDFSIDPYLIGQMCVAPLKLPVPAFEIGKAVYSYGVGVVVRSESASAKAGDHVYGILDHAHYNIKKDLSSAGLEILDNAHNLPWSTYLGPRSSSQACHFLGKTSYYGWKEYSKAKKGETVFVSTGAGAVGSLVIQLAKRDGLKVIGSAGSEEKVQFMKEIGADVAFNYKTTSTKEVLAKEKPIDIYWDNVGGETLDAALGAMAVNGRIIVCGMISSLANQNAAGIKNLGQIIPKSITINGFAVNRLEDKHGEDFGREMPPLVASGEIKHKEHVWNGLENVGDALLAVLKGTNKAKAIIHVADD